MVIGKGGEKKSICDLNKNNFREWKWMFGLIERNWEILLSYEEYRKRFGGKSFF